MKKALSEAKARWTASTPVFWKKVIRVMTYLSTVCIAILGLTQIQGFEVDPMFTKVVSYVMAACVACGVQAKFAKE